MSKSDSNIVQAYLEQHRLLQHTVYAIIVATVIGTLGYHAVVRALNTETLAARPCPRPGSTNEVVVDDTAFQSREAVVARCDQLMFINRGQRSHRPVFGEHPKHIIYPSYQERVLKPGQSNSATMSVPGTYAVHDHLDESIQGQVVVTE